MPPKQPFKQAASTPRDSASSFDREQTNTTRSSRIRASKERKKGRTTTQQKNFSYRRAGQFVTSSVIPAFNKALEEQNQKMAEEDIAEIVAVAPEKPHFPILIFIAAVLKDLSDVPTNALVFTISLSWIESAILGVVIFIWMLGKMGFAQKAALRWVLVLIFEMIPGLMLMPIFSIFVFLTYYREKKIVQIFLSTLENIKKGHV